MTRNNIDYKYSFSRFFADIKTTMKNNPTFATVPRVSLSWYDLRGTFSSFFTFSLLALFIDELYDYGKFLYGLI